MRSEKRFLSLMEMIWSEDNWMNFARWINCEQYPPRIESRAISSGEYWRTESGILDATKARKIYSCCLFFKKITCTKTSKSYQPMWTSLLSTLVSITHRTGANSQRGSQINLTISNPQDSSTGGMDQPNASDSFIPEGQQDFCQKEKCLFVSSDAGLIRRNL